ncbi:scavenger receptor class F member 1-like [Haliotis rubra]|uniref:scavenger receptor class F member 1-like n=1 Tax=Haliotis rubra TaxID=36100 RepID=UPI001EE5C34A|nr:scavenger receptor class F member 1-like [Haliotis rubra]
MVKIIFVMYVAFALESAHGQCGDHCLDCKHGTCRECIFGWFGADCSKKCQGCWYGRCEQDTGRCVQCSPGYYSDGCFKRCSLNCCASVDGNRYCDRDAGRCLEGCVPGRWGHQCQKPCPGNCDQSACHQDVGTCLLGCTDGWFGGQLCDKPCPENCLWNRCNLVQGYCGQCKPGFIGPKCDIRCRNCVDNTCTYNELLSSVTCTRGCVRGWSDEDCQSPCSNRCVGVECNINGTCKKCPDGHYGGNCTVPCASSCLRCEQTSGLCTSKRQGRYLLNENSNDSPTKSTVMLSQGSPTISPISWMWISASLCYVLNHGWD